MYKKLTAYILFTLLLCHAGTTVLAQANVLPPNQPEQDACNAISICGNKFYIPFSYQGNGRVKDIMATPCYGAPDGAEVNSMWVRLKVVTSGTLVFKIVPVEPADDYDFAMFNITGTGCSSLSSANTVRCNFNGNITGSNPGGIVGLDMTSDVTSVFAGSYGQSFCKYIDAVAGETYLLMINNYGNDNDPGPSEGFTLDFTGSTASYSQTPPPAFASINAPVCYDANSITLQLTHPVLCDSIATDGSGFTLSPSVPIIKAAGVNCYGFGGYAHEITITLARPPGPGKYTLNAKRDVNGNTLVDICNNPMQLPASIAFTIAPPIKAVDNESICYSDLPYFWNGIKISQAGNNAASFTTITTAGQCDSTVILNLTVSPAPVATTIVKTICAGAPFKLPWNDSAVNTAGIYTHTYNNLAGCDSLESTITISIDNPSKNTQGLICRDSSKLLAIGPGFSKYVWNNGMTAPFIIINQPGVYTVQANDSLGCTASDTLTILTDTTSVGLAKNVLLCQGTTIVIDAGGGFAGYVWSNGSRKQSISVNSPGSYLVTAIDANNCPVAGTATVIAAPLPAGFLPSAIITKCMYNTVTLQPAGNFNAYLWSTGATTPAINVSLAGTYTLQVTDVNGCLGISSENVVDSACARFLYMPAAFSPNGDAHNDVFKPVYEGLVDQYSFLIYNRWGHKIFESNNPANGWDGTVNGKRETTGVYVWICRYRWPGQQQVSQKGTVVLMR